ncbi:MAG: serine/threonine-protein kinase [Gammaproteobacteria bacterium]
MNSEPVETNSAGRSQAPANALPIGSLIQEYRVTAVVGAGEFGIVYKAENVYLDEVVAIKEFLPEELAYRRKDMRVVPVSPSAAELYEWALRKFVDEARLLWDLARPQPHPNIVRVTRFHEANGTAYMVMDLEEGKPLSELLQEQGTFGEAEIEAIMLPLLDGLAKVHDKHICHRDIKPANILIRSDGSPVLIDFGAARWKSANSEKSIISLYTPAYAAPEQSATGEDTGTDVGPHTDVYSLGATIYRAITGSPPTPATRRLLGVEYVPVAEAVTQGQYDESLLTSIDAALAIAPDDRLPDTKIWAAKLGAIRTGARRGQELADEDDDRTRIMTIGDEGERETPDPARKPLARTATAWALTAALVGGGGYYAMQHWRAPIQVHLKDESARSAPGATVRTDNTDSAALPRNPVDGATEATGTDRVSMDASSKSTDGSSEDSNPIAQLQGTTVRSGCTHIKVVATAPALSLAGFTADRAALQSVLRAMTGASDIEVPLNMSNVDLVPSVYCRPLALLSESFNLLGERGGGIELNHPNGQYVEEDAFELAVTAPRGGYLYVDYIDPQGLVNHLRPQPSQAPRWVGANTITMVGREERLIIAPPHGENLVVAFVSPTPLFPRGRSASEPIEDYVRALEREAPAHAGDSEAWSSYRFVETKPR